MTPCKVSEFVREYPLAYEENATVAEAVRGMADRSMGSVIVTAADEIIGLFAERDLVKRALLFPVVARSSRERLEPATPETPETHPDCTEVL